MSESISEEPEDAAAAPAPSRKAEREGLPPGYRMRADAHYVEQLTSRRGEKAIEQPRTLSESSERYARADQLLTQLAEDLATVESAVAGLSAETSRMAKRVNVDLIKSQIWRASWSLRANAILGGAHRGQIRPRPLGFLLGQVRSGWAAECRLAGITLHVHASDWNAVVAVDEASVVVGLTGALVSTLGLVG